jgi:o-succinylbenzoate---CoA ligase
MQDLTINLTGNQILLSPQFKHLQEDLEVIISDHGLQDHLLFLSSGTTSKTPKGYAFHKSALALNAEAVNKHLNLGPTDRWGLTLTSYHIGGIGIILRSQLLGEPPVPCYPWKPETISEAIQIQKITIISLVPTQIYDLVKYQIKAPRGLKIVLVGGDFLGEALRKEAENLGWPIVRTFGMSEVGPQLATGGDLHQGLTPLLLHKLKVDTEHNLWVKTPSLFTIEFKKNEQWVIRKAQDLLDEEGYYPLSDKVKLQAGRVIPLGRADGALKISGRLINLFELKNELDTFAIHHDVWGKIELATQLNPREGQELVLFYSTEIKKEIIFQFLDLIAPIKVNKIIPGIRRNELGKLIIHPSNN